MLYVGATAYGLMKESGVVITGMGFVSSMGCDTATVEDSLRKGRHGFSKVNLRKGMDLPINVAVVVAWLRVSLA